MGLFLSKSSFKMLGMTFPYKFDWGTYSIAKTVSKKIGSLIHSMKFLSPKVALYLFFNWDSLHARLNSHCKTCNYKTRERSTKRLKHKEVALLIIAIDVIMDGSVFEEK